MSYYFGRQIHISIHTYTDIYSIIIWAEPYYFVIIIIITLTTMLLLLLYYYYYSYNYYYRITVLVKGPVSIVMREGKGW